MDDTQQSQTSDAAATRKRRSSILKSQRPVRTPFSELEFNVATPTDTAKSRRVSFSRRTGVAEFITNEATTTWKNVYEKHNKSLESSGNDSEFNAARQPVEHLGRRLYHQQFEEVVGSLTPTLSANASLNNINFTQPIAAVEFTAEEIVAAPHNKFELSALTDHQGKLFGNDFTVTGVSGLSGKIDLNFSNIQHIGENDDLDEIERDLKRATNVICQGPDDRHNISEYIAVDWNMTHVDKSDDCDMSITETVSSPKVQNMSRSCSIDKKVNLDKDWMTDKENIAVNPYAEPREDDKFAVNDEPNQVLVFDGKRLTLQTEKYNKDNHTPPRKTLVVNTNDDLPNFVDDFKFDEPRASTAHYYHHDVCTKAVHKVDISTKKAVHDSLNNISHLNNISITQSLPTKFRNEKNQTIVHNETDSGDISITQSVNGQILTANNKSVLRRRTVVYENETGNISITQALPTNIIQNVKPDKRKTIVFDEDGGNISITQGITSKVNSDQNISEKRKTIVFDDDKANISITQVLPSQVILDQNIQEKRKTIVFDDDSGNISITQAIPASIVLESQRLDKHKTIIYEDNTGNISITQAAPTNLIITGNPGMVERRRTILYEDDTGNISVTQSLPQNIILGKPEVEENTQIFDTSNISMTQAIPTNIILKDSGTNKRRTIVYDDDTGNISITQAIPTQLIPGIESQESVPSSNDDCIVNSSTNVITESANKSRTVIYDEADDVSMTQAIPSNIILLNQKEVENGHTENDEVHNEPENEEVQNEQTENEKFESEETEKEEDEETLVVDDDMCVGPLPEEVSAGVFLLSGMISSDEGLPTMKYTQETIDRQISKQDFEKQDSVTDIERRRTVVFADENCETEISIIDAIPQIQNVLQESFVKQDKGILSLTKPIPDELVVLHANLFNKLDDKASVLSDQVNVSNQNIMVYQTAKSNISPTSDTTEHGDSNSGVNADYESNITTSSKAAETEMTESQSSKQPSVLSPMLSKDNVGHVIESKSEIFDIKTNVPDMKTNDDKIETTVSKDPFNVEVSKITVLHNLLDMSEPVNSDIHKKPSKTIFEPTAPSPVMPEAIPEKESSMLYYITEEDVEVQTDKIEIDNDADNDSSSFHFTRDSSGSSDHKEQDEHLQNALTELIENRDNIIENSSVNTSGTVDKDEIALDHKNFNSSVNTSGEDDEDEKALDHKNFNISPISSSADDKDEKNVHHKSFKEANDTKELLDMICDFTDTSRCASKEMAISSVSVEDKMEGNEPRRLSFATKRQSIIISREDLLNNISMARAILRESRVDLADISPSENHHDSSLEEYSNVSKRSHRLSHEVVKTLHFDDESVSENSLKPDLSITSPLKKTTFGETSYAKDNTKAHVIPTYLKDVSDGLKQLMSELVKPMSDAIPFETYDERRPKRSISTVSTQIQANLITSSQIDVDAELSSDPGSREDVSSYYTRNSILKTPVPPLNLVDASDNSSEMEVVPAEIQGPQPACVLQGSPPHVLVFDHDNPLNNILLGPLSYIQAHDYKPMRSPVAIENLKKSDETLCGSERSQSCQINMDVDSSSIDTNVMGMPARNVEVNTETIVTQFCTAVHGRQENRLFFKPSSKDRSVHVHSEVENTEVNTVIAMKPNKELLETSSSLTIIEDTSPESKTKSESSWYHVAKKKDRKSSVRRVVTIEAPSAGETDITSNDDADAEHIKCKGKKRSHIPSSPNRRASIDITPKPNSKILKISDTPNQNRILLRMSHEPTKIPAERDTEGHDSQAEVNKIDDKTKRDKKQPNHSYNSSITIQQLITEYQIDAGINKEILDVLKGTESNIKKVSSHSESVTSDSLDKVCSFTSSKNHGSIKNTPSMSITGSSLKSQSTGHQSKECVRLDWHPELSSMTANKYISHFDSGVNIVSKIDMLPFMGSYECERESSLGDTWSFLLLHGRIRLTVRLAHRHDNSTRTRVRADTPVTDVSVDTIEYDKKNPVAILCIRFACETMRYMVSSGTENKYLARDVPLLLRRCAAVARVALRWGRAMHDAKLHLAYTLDLEGHLSLKVANIPLRSVWEVSMDLELVLDNPTQAPWPRAGNVRVNRVVSDVTITDEDVRRTLKHTPNDWGHAPKTLWRMFRYLKHKQRDDVELLLSV